MIRRSSASTRLAGGPCGGRSKGDSSMRSAVCGTYDRAAKAKVGECEKKQRWGERREFAPDSAGGEVRGRSGRGCRISRARDLRRLFGVDSLSARKRVAGAQRLISVCSPGRCHFVTVSDEISPCAVLKYDQSKPVAGVEMLHPSTRAPELNTTAWSSQRCEPVLVLLPWSAGSRSSRFFASADARLG